MQHVPDEVVRFGPLMAYTCYKFESYLFVLKRDVRSGRNPMRQVINRYEKFFTAYAFKIHFTMKRGIFHLRAYKDIEIFKNKYKNLKNN